MSYDKAKKLRCDHCQKWVREHSLSTLPEELYPMLAADNEFGICEQCYVDHSVNDLNYWQQWLNRKLHR